MPEDRTFSFAWGSGRQRYDEDKDEFVDQPVIEVVADDVDDLEEMVEVLELMEDWTAEDIKKAVRNYA